MDEAKRLGIGLERKIVVERLESNQPPSCRWEAMSAKVGRHRRKRLLCSNNSIIKTVNQDMLSL